MMRREFITLLGGAAAAWPLAVRAEQLGGLRRIALLLGWSASDLDVRDLVAAFLEELARRGWIDGRNAQIEQRWTNADGKRTSAFAADLVALQPDVIFCATTPATAALHRETSTIPIVFAIVSDPVGAGFVASLAHPAGNMTGFTQTDPALGGKWLSLLKQAAPDLQRVATMFNPDTAPAQGTFFKASFEAAARSLAIEPVVLPVRSGAEIEAGIAALGQERSGLVMGDDSFIVVHYRTVLSAAARNNVPAICFATQFAKDGGLMAYQCKMFEQFRGAASYVDRILHGEKADDLPVQTPTKYELTINLKTARALGLAIPPLLLATADEIIE